MTRPADKKERVICAQCGTGKTVDKAIWKKQGRTKCLACGTWIPHYDAPEDANRKETHR